MNMFKLDVPMKLSNKKLSQWENPFHDEKNNCKVSTKKTFSIFLLKLKCFFTLKNDEKILSSGKQLGINLDTKITWGTQVVSVCKQLSILPLIITYKQ